MDAKEKELLALLAGSTRELRRIHAEHRAFEEVLPPEVERVLGEPPGLRAQGRAAIEEILAKMRV